MKLCTVFSNVAIAAFSIILFACAETPKSNSAKADIAKYNQWTQEQAIEREKKAHCLAKRLDLTPEQQKELEFIMETHFGMYVGLEKKYGIDETFHKQAAAIAKSREKAIKSMLTRQQKLALLRIKRAAKKCSK